MIVIHTYTTQTDRRTDRQTDRQTDMAKINYLNPSYVFVVVKVLMGRVSNEMELVIR